MTCTFYSGDDGQYDDNSDNDELRGRKVNERYRQETLMILRGEIEFQFRRVFKKVVGTKKGGDVPTLFLQLGRGDDDNDGQKQEKPKKKTQMNGRPNKTFTDDKVGVTCNHNLKYASNEKEEQHNNDNDDGEKKEEFILQTIFESQPFQNMTQKLHKKFFHLAEETYCAFLVEIQKCSNRLMEEEQKQASSCSVRGVGGSRKKKKQKDNHSMPRITVVETEHDDHDSAGADIDRQLKVTFMGISLRINEWHREKLMSLYERTLSNWLRLKKCDTRQLQQQFPKLLFSLLLRYDALEGSGLQPSIPPNVFRYLHRRFGCELECFASPFNCYWSVKEDIISSGGGGGVGGRSGSAISLSNISGR